MKDEIRAAIRKTKLGKVSGLDSISVGLLAALEDYGIDKMTTLPLKSMIPADISKSMFIELPKKPRAREYELRRTTSLMTHSTRILLRIMLRVRKKSHLK